MINYTSHVCGTCSTHVYTFTCTMYLHDIWLIYDVTQIKWYDMVILPHTWSFTCMYMYTWHYYYIHDICDMVFFQKKKISVAQWKWKDMYRKPKLILNQMNFISFNTDGTMEDIPGVTRVPCVLFTICMTRIYFSYTCVPYLYPPYMHWATPPKYSPANYTRTGPLR